MPRPMLPRIISCSGRSWSGSTTTSLGSRLIRHRRASSVYSSSRNPWPASPGPAQPTSHRMVAWKSPGATNTALLTCKSSCRPTAPLRFRFPQRRRIRFVKAMDRPPVLAACALSASKATVQYSPSNPVTTAFPRPCDPAMKARLLVMIALLASAVCHAGPLTLTIPATRPAPVETFAFGTARRPDGATITADSKSLRLDGRLWTPVMGEFHYARYPQGEWRDELLKMKAGGIDIVASYVFSIHPEEIEGQWDSSGSRDLRRFVELAHEVGLKG